MDATLGDVTTNSALQSRRAAMKVRASGRGTVLIVEFRDEVFARLSADLELFGLEVQRARNARDAAKPSVRVSPIV